MTAKRIDLAPDLIRWGLRADSLSAEATRSSAELEDRLRQARRSVEVAIRMLRGVATWLDPSEERARRIEEVARDSGDAATRTDLLALNFQVEAARLEDDRGLDQVAHEIRTLADRGARGSTEVDELCQTLLRELTKLRAAWQEGKRRVEAAQESLERAVRASDRTGRLLAEARGVSAQFAAGVSTHAQGAAADEGTEAASRLAAAAEVRGETIERLARAVAGGLRKTGAGLEQEARRAEETAHLVETFETKLGRLVELVQSADEMSRRAKQLAISADLAATRSDDPAFGLFAEEARRLSDQAERTADAAQVHLGIASQSHSPAVESCRELSGSLTSIARDLTGLLDRFAEGLEGEGEAGEEIEGLAQIWRSDRAAAQELAQARAQWRLAHGAEVPPEDEDEPPPSKL